jgi:hypothetical protein
MTLLGTEMQNGRPVELSSEGRRQGTYIVGINGTGKSTLLLNVALQDIAAGDGLCLLDPHGDLVKEVLERIPENRIDDVILFDPADVENPFGLNPFDCPPDQRDNPKVVDRICSEVVLTLKKLFQDSWGPRLEDLLRNSILTLMATPNSSLLDMLLMLTDEKTRQRYTARVTDPIISRYWQSSFPPSDPKKPQSTKQAEHVSSTLNKIGRFLTNPVIRNIVAQPKSTFDFRTLMDEGKVILVNLSKGELGEDNSSLLGSVLVGKILIAALSRSDTEVGQRRPFHLIVDEYHSFATESFPTLQSEARKFGIDTMVAHQYRDQLDILNRGSTLNVGNFVLFRITGRDAREMAMQFDNSPPEPEDVLKSIPYRTGREGVYRTAGDQLKVKGSSRSYGDVSNETANYLANVPNYRAYCKLIEGPELAEYFIAAARCELERDESIGERIRENSQALAPMRADVEKYIADRFRAGHSPSTNGAQPETPGVTYE